MSRYIDAYKLWDAVDSIDTVQGLSNAVFIYDVIQAIENEPTADVAKVVRCKDCKYYRDGHCGVLGFCEPDEFCSRGERRKDNAEIH